MKHGFILLWPHGFKYKEQILTKIAEKYKIIYHNSFKINNLENFVMSLYVNENSDIILVNTAATPASNAFPPSENICFAVSTHSFDPAEIAPYFI